MREVTKEDQKTLTEEFVKVGRQYGMTIRMCCENADLARFGADVSGCMTKPILEPAAGFSLAVPKNKNQAREECQCLLGNDIGMYNTCGHACLYCYANYDRKTVIDNMKKHDVNSSFLVGGRCAEDIVKESKQVSYRDGQLSLFDM